MPGLQDNLKQKALSKRVAAVEKLASDLGVSGVVATKKPVGNGAFFETSVKYISDTAVVFCLEDFFSKPEFCDGILEDQRRNARKRRHREVVGSEFVDRVGAADDWDETRRVESSRGCRVRFCSE